MRTFATLFAVAVLCAGQSTSEQSLDRVFQFIHTDKERNLQEIATAIRTITDIKQASVDPAQKSVAMSGTAAQIGLAEWLWKELDQSPQAPPNQDAATYEYRLPDGAADRGESLVRVFYLPKTATVQNFQEVATLVRTMAEIRRVFTYNESRALVMRGTVDQIAAAEWLIDQIGDLTKPQTNSATREYRMADAKVKGIDEGLMRVYFLPHTATVQDFQEAATLVRAIAEIRRVFTYNAPRAVAVRGTDDQIALADWLFQALDQPTNAPREYRISGSKDDIVRVFYLTRAGTTQRVQEIATEVRTATGIPRVFTNNTARVVAVRGTSAQIAQADRIVKERDQ